MEKVKIKICCGTSCFVMGAAQIQVLEFAPPADIADKIEIEEARCMNYCKNTADRSCWSTTSLSKKPILKK